MSDLIRTCRECHQVLTEVEVEYYGSRCEQCESEWHEELTRWRYGEENPTFDAMFDAQEPTKH